LPTLDILIPHHDAPDALAASLESVRRQSWQGELRVIVLDDGSEREARVAAERITSESGLSSSFLANSGNRGRPYSRNRLLDAIEASHAAWLDAGDLWYPQKIEEQFRRLNEIGASGEDVERVWLTCDYDWRWQGQAAIPVVQVVSSDQVSLLLEGDRLRAYLWTLLASTSSLRRLGYFDEKLPRLQDLDFVLRFLIAGGRMDKPQTIEPHPLCRYEKSDVGRDAMQVRACQEYLFAKHRGVYRSRGAAFERRCRAKADLHAARFAWHNRQWTRAVRFGASALAVDPASVARRLLKATLAR
jgi:glycosyltransferase involved in cell wall biosynthesis